MAKIEGRQGLVQDLSREHSGISAAVRLSDKVALLRKQTGLNRDIPQITHYPDSPQIVSTIEEAARLSAIERQLHYPTEELSTRHPIAECSEGFSELGSVFGKHGLKAVPPEENGYLRNEVAEKVALAAGLIEAESNGKYTLKVKRHIVLLSLRSSGFACSGPIRFRGW